ncbi:MAG: hypothetical protein JXB32_04495 [Deltaproteobacteria bacterium]|nr:hypothetical protein [Deltaproteobacteria bacterium]
MRAARWLVLVVAVVGLGCGKKGPAPAGAAPESGQYLPAEAAGYFELDVKALMASSLIQPLRDKMLEQVPPACRPLVDRTERLVLALYGSPDALLGGMFGARDEEYGDEPGEGEGRAEEPASPMPDMALLLKGPAAADLRSCLDGLAKEGDQPVREEERNGRKILFGGRGEQFALVSPTDTVHVMCTVPRLDAVLATMAGGPSIEGSELLKTMATMSSGAIVGALLIPESVAAMMTEGFAMFAGDKPVPAPRSAALSIGLGDAVTVAAAMTFTDEAGAQGLLDIANGLIGAAKAAMAMAGADNPEAAPYKRMLDSLSLSRSGATLTGRISISGDLLKMLL